MLQHPTGDEADAADEPQEALPGDPRPGKGDAADKPQETLQETPGQEGSLRPALFMFPGSRAFLIIIPIEKQ